MVAEHQFGWIVGVVDREDELMVEEVRWRLSYLVLHGEIVACETAELFLGAESEQSLDIAMMVE